MIKKYHIFINEYPKGALYLAPSVNRSETRAHVDITRFTVRSYLVLEFDTETGECKTTTVLKPKT